MNAIRIGETYYLVPKTLGAPAICYKQPKVTVVLIRDPYVVVRLENGAEHEVRSDNIARNLPAPSQPRTEPARRPVDLPEGMEEVTLW